MGFTAKIRRHTAVWRRWTAEKRVGGNIAGVVFHRIRNGDFASKALNPDQIAAVAAYQFVDLEATGVPMDAGMDAEKAEMPENLVESTNFLDTETDTGTKRARGRPRKNPVFGG